MIPSIGPTLELKVEYVSRTWMFPWVQSEGQMRKCTGPSLWGETRRRTQQSDRCARGRRSWQDGGGLLWASGTVPLGPVCSPRTTHLTRGGLSRSGRYDGSATKLEETGPNLCCSADSCSAGVLVLDVGFVGP